MFEGRLLFTYAKVYPVSSTSSDTFFKHLLYLDSEFQGDEHIVQWFVDVLEWIREERKSSKKNPFESIANAVAKNPDQKLQLVNQLERVLVYLSHPVQLVSCGLPTHRSFVEDFMRRVMEKILPQTPLKNNLQSVLESVSSSLNEKALIQFVGEQDIKFLEDILGESSKVKSQLSANCYNALGLLTALLLENSLSIRMRMSRDIYSTANLPEIELQRALDCTVEELGRKGVSSLHSTLEHLEAEIESLFDSVGRSGVEVETVYLIELYRRRLHRARCLVCVLDPNIKPSTSISILLFALIKDISRERGFLVFLRKNLALLSQRVVQVNSKVGEHYVAQTAEEMRHIFKSAIGGGVITAATVFIKHGLAQMRFSGIIKGFSESMNYSLSFLIIQLLGFTLATKQPSTTAPFLLNVLKQSFKDGNRALRALMRTQILAVLGNIAAVAPICFGVSWLANYWGYPLMSPDEVRETVRSSNLIGPSFIFASYTGVLLFLSSLFAGWFENFSVVTQLPQRIQFNRRIIRGLGYKNAVRLANFFGNHGTAFAANMSLGFFLGLSAPVMKFMNLFLEARHVTLATGALSAALPLAQFEDYHNFDLFNAIAGLGVIGLMNLTVSFILAFMMASLSSNERLGRALWSNVKYIVKRPWKIILPDREST